MALDFPSKYAYGTHGNDLRMLEDTLSPATRGFYGATDSDVQDMLDALNLGSYQNYGTPEEVFPGDPMRDPETGTGQRGDLMRRMDPQEFIGMQLAGDVVPLRPGVNNLDERIRRLQSGEYLWGRGQKTLDMFGGDQRHLDLLNVLMYPTGRPAGR